jgi:hypothetical protein
MKLKLVQGIADVLKGGKAGKPPPVFVGGGAGALVCVAARLSSCVLRQGRPFL